MAGGQTGKVLQRAAGSIGGAALGGLVAGPPGAALGGAIGGGATTSATGGDPGESLLFAGLGGAAGFGGASALSALSSGGGGAATAAGAGAAAPGDVFASVAAGAGQSGAAPASTGFLSSLKENPLLATSLAITAGSGLGGVVNPQQNAARAPAPSFPSRGSAPSPTAESSLQALTNEIARRRQNPLGVFV